MISLLEVLVDLPTVLPPAVAGFALLMAFGRRGLLGGTLDALGLQIPFTTLAVIMAQTFVSAPFYIKTAAVGLSAVSREPEQAAALDGATGWTAFQLVMLPLAWRSLMGGHGALLGTRVGRVRRDACLRPENLPGRAQTMPLVVYLGFEMDQSQAFVAVHDPFGNLLAPSFFVCEPY